jgi:type IV pilus assembly protein PilN
VIRLNLLPYREELRAQRKRQTLMLFGLAAVAAAGLAFLVHAGLAARVSHQQSRNAVLETEIKKLEAQIVEISSIKEQTQALLERKKVVESLQANRADAVHILDQMLRLLPDGVYLKEIRQAGDRIEVWGYAQSHARVSTLMNAFDQSRWLEGSALVEIKAVTVDKARANEFNLVVKLEREKTEESSKTGAPPPVQAKTS